MRVAVIGGGASGMMAAIQAAKKHEVTLFERQERVGRKLMATGNGRCNLTNLHANVTNYHGKDPIFVSNALERFGVADTLAFFESIGLVWTSDESGRVYPFSDQAGSVVDVLRYAVRSAGVTVRTAVEVTEIKRASHKYEILGEKFDRVIVACGGRAGEHIGGTDLGCRLLKNLGHTVLSMSPGLVQLKTDIDFVKMLKGVRAGAEVSLLRKGREIRRKSGEVQFTEYGVSGIVILDLSGYAEAGDELRLDLIPPVDLKELTEMLMSRRRAMGEENAENLFAGIVHNRLGKCLVKRVGVDGNVHIADLTDAELKKAALTAKSFTLTVRGKLGFPEAQVMRGGADTREFDSFTLRSKLCPGLYACGEVLDVDGDCGGYNLQWAWSSGAVAGWLE